MKFNIILFLFLFVVTPFSYCQETDLLAWWSLDKTGEFKSNVLLNTQPSTLYSNWSDVNGLKNSSASGFSSSAQDEFFNINDDYTLFFWTYRVPTGSTYSGESGLSVGFQNITNTAKQTKYVEIYSPGNTLRISVGDGDEYMRIAEFPFKLETGKWYWLCLRKVGLNYSLDVKEKGRVFSETIHASKFFDKKMNVLFLYGGDPLVGIRRFDDVYIFNRFITDDEMNGLEVNKLSYNPPIPIQRPIQIERAISLTAYVESFGLYDLQFTKDFVNWQHHSTHLLNIGNNSVFVKANAPISIFRFVKNN